jgi:putative RNA 2'-phosphotransferase
VGVSKVNRSNYSFPHPALRATLPARGRVSRSDSVFSRKPGEGEKGAMAQDLVRASKFMSLVLRHKPEEIGLVLDRNGWAGIGELIEKARAHGVALTRELIAEVTATSDKQRFAIDESGQRIRANQGHSVDVELGLEPRAPPDVLFHGTAVTSVAAIRAEGLKPGRRQHVHLSPDEETATRVGARHGKPVVLRIAAARMQGQGHAFFLSTNGVWLTDCVPAEFIAFPA